MTFRNFYDNVCKFDPDDFSGRQTAYTNDFVDRMPPDSGARKLHNEVLALHKRTEKLVLNQRDYWNDPGESSDFRFLVVENVPVYKDGGKHGFDLGVWLPDMLSCVEALDPFHVKEDEGASEDEDADATEDEDADATEDEDANATEDEDAAEDATEVKDAAEDATEVKDAAKKDATDQTEGTIKYYFSDKVEREQLARDLDALGADIKALMQSIEV